MVSETRVRNDETTGIEKIISVVDSYFYVYEALLYAPQYRDSARRGFVKYYLKNGLSVSVYEKLLGMACEHYNRNFIRRQEEEKKK